MYKTTVILELTFSEVDANVDDAIDVIRDILMDAIKGKGTVIKDETLIKLKVSGGIKDIKVQFRSY